MSNQQKFNPLAYMTLKCAELESQSGEWERRALAAEEKLAALAKSAGESSDGI